MSARSKPFQQATVAAATNALAGANPLRRFLVADEVGLGKTVVARDVLAALGRKARKFTVYYISSGQKVADQNKVELLRFLEEDDADAALSKIDRLGLIPFEEKRAGSLRLYLIVSGQLYVLKPLARSAQTSSRGPLTRLFHS